MLTERDRSTPSFIWVPSPGVALPEGAFGGSEMPSFRRMAESRFHNVRHSAIVQPRLVLESNNTQTNDDDNATKLV